MNMHVEQAAGRKLSVMMVMDSSGHTTVTWDPTDPDSVRDAQREFDGLRAQGYSAFRMSAVADSPNVVVEAKGERIDTFDPQAGKLMLVPQRVGG